MSELADRFVLGDGDPLVEVTSDDVASLQWLREFLVPPFVIATDAPVPYRIHVTVDGREYRRHLERGPHPGGEEVETFTLDAAHERLPRWSADGLTVFDRRRGAFYRTEDGGRRFGMLAGSGRAPVFRIGLMRLVRELATRRRRARGDLHVHGAAFATPAGQGIVIIGPKRSGKTALLLHALGAPGPQFVANDRVFVEGGETAPLVCPMPTIVKIRRDTWERFPDLARGLAGTRHRHVLTLAESSAGRPWGKLDQASRMYLSPAQLCDLLGVGAAGQVPLATLLFPRMRADRDGLELRDLPPDEALPLLESGLFADGGRSPRFFAADPASGDDAPAPSPAPLRMLVQRVRCAEVSLGTNAYAEGSAAFVASVS